jgi:uncharacterized protein
VAEPPGPAAAGDAVGAPAPTAPGPTTTGDAVGPPGPTTTGDADLATQAERIVVGFAQVVRGLGLDVPVGSVIAFARALGEVGLDRRSSVYWAGRATLVHRPEDVPAYDRAFAQYWGDRPGWTAPRRTVSVTLQLDSEEGDDGSDAVNPDDGDGDDSPTLSMRYSPVEILRQQDFAAYSEADWAEARRLLTYLRHSSMPRRSRRRSPDKHQRGEPDLGRTVRRALVTDGEPIKRAWRAPSERPRRIVYLVDVSGSMEVYARGFLRFAHASVCSRATGLVEVFVLGTRLTRVTRPLSWRDPDLALADVSRAVEDWYGGTRLGAGLKEFNDRWGIRGMARGAVVVILSDGWDRGDPDALATEMARLQRVAYRVIWVNPLKASPGYTPIARGMAAAMPYVDEFVEGHSLGSLEELAQRIGGGGGRPARSHAG